MRPAWPCFAWPPVAPAPTTKRPALPPTPRARPAMCALQRIVDIAARAARRRQSDVVAAATPRYPAPGPGLSESEMKDVAALVSSVSAATLGVCEREVERDGKEIGYISVVEREEVTMAVFIIPPGSVIPLHDHVGMFVASRILFGKLEVREYDLMNKNGCGEMKRTWEGVRYPVTYSEAGETRILTPTKRNIHSFHTDRWTAVFDVLMPPYRTDSVNDCKYYEAMSIDDGNRKKPARTGQGLERVLLTEVQCPSYYSTISIPYQGDEIL